MIDPEIIFFDVQRTHLPRFTSVTHAVSTGDPLGEVIAQIGFNSPLTINLFQTGEDTRELSQMLDELAAIYDDEAGRVVNGAVKLLGPLLIVVDLIIAGIVAAVMLPIFQSSAVV